MPAIRFSALGTAARRAIGAAVAGACVCGAAAASAEDASGQGGGATLLDYDFGFLTAPASGAALLDYDFGFLTRSGPASASSSASQSGAAQTSGFALRYDFGFLTHPGGSASLLQKATTITPNPAPVAPAAAFVGTRIARSLVVGDVDYGIGDTGVVDNKLFVASNLAAIAGLPCGEVRMAGDVSLCAVGVRKFWTEGERLFVDPVLAVEAEAGGPRTAPELARANLGFLNYDLSLVSAPDGATSVYGSLHPALRLKDNAFDAEATLYQAFGGPADNSRAGTRVALTGFAYRREWFEQRLRLVAGAGAVAIAWHWRGRAVRRDFAGTVQCR